MVLLLEIADLLGAHGRLPGTLRVDHDDGTVTLTVRLVAPGQLDALALAHDAQYLADVGQLRDLAMRYDIDPRRLEAVLPPRKDDHGFAR